MVGTDLVFGYQPGHPVIQGLSAELHSGQLCALIGPNAAGKSTLLRLFLGHLEPWSGSVELNGECVARIPASQRAKSISYVPQRAGAGFAFTVQEVVAMGRYAMKTDPAIIEQSLRSCDLWLLRHQVYAYLSVGQQQRVLLARAIAQATGTGCVMLLDEPSNGMDLWHVHQTMGTLLSLARSGLAVLVVMHDPNLAARYADTVWLMDHGRIVRAGPWDSVLVPSVLEPVYRVRIRALSCEDHDRPVFSIEPRDL